MSIPLDRLYYYIEDVSQEIYRDSVVIYRFYPYGCKNIENLQPLHNHILSWKQTKQRPQIFCNDQEPLNFGLYDHIPQSHIDTIHASHIYNEIRQHGFVLPRKNLRLNAMTIWDKALLLHSEQRSDQIQKYIDCDFLPVYYWSHAIIAQDWFRFAEHVRIKKQPRKQFLIYARGWTGTREYRLKFLEKLIENDLHVSSKITIQPLEPGTGQYYGSYKFEHPHWKPNICLENFLSVSDQISSEASADFDIDDYASTEIEVVLETLFDDNRLHFTEKILRPIAVGQPFILAGGHGGLEYLKQYGFKTFSDVWSEQYDQIQNHELRMGAIIDLMKEIVSWSAEKKNAKNKQIDAIVEYNKQRFFSKSFFEQVEQELRDNLAQAFDQLQKFNTCRDYFEFRNRVFEDRILWEKFLQVRSQQDADEIHNVALSYLNQRS